MDLKRKIEIANQAIQSIATHNDEDSVVIKAALASVKLKVELAEKQVDDYIVEQTSKALGD